MRLVNTKSIKNRKVSKIKEGKFVFNLYIPKIKDETTEIVIILFHPKGLFVIENENYNGWIFGNETNRN